MLTLQQIKADPAKTIERLAIKGFDGKEPIAKVLELDNPVSYTHLRAHET